MDSVDESFLWREREIINLLFNNATNKLERKHVIITSKN